jgi:hypothetical protein
VWARGWSFFGGENSGIKMFEIDFLGELLSRVLEGELLSRVFEGDILVGLFFFSESIFFGGSFTQF